MELQLAAFLKKERNGATYASFSRRMKIPVGTLHRIENGEQSASLYVLDQIVRRLDVPLTEIFKND